MAKLPHPPRRALLSTLWWSLTLAVGVVLGIGVALLSASATSGGITLGVVLLLGVAGWRVPGLPIATFQGWNRITELSEYVVSRWTLTVLYAIVTVVSIPGTRMRLGKPPADVSQWDPFGERAIGEASEPRRSGSKGLLSWALRSGNHWLILAMPLLQVVRAFHSRSQSHDPPSNIYTLY